MLLLRYRDAAISRYCDIAIFDGLAAATGRQLPRALSRALDRVAARPSTKKATAIQLPQCGGYDDDMALI